MQCTLDIHNLHEHHLSRGIDDFVIVYIDNILVYSKTAEEHARHLESVLGRLRDNKLYANGEKSDFAHQEIEFLGHVVIRDGIKPDMKKVNAIQEWKRPSTQKGLGHSLA